MGTPSVELAPFVLGKTRVFCCHKATLSGDRGPNTLAAVAECIAAGAPRLEIDVQFLKDGTPIVFHDETLEGDTDGQGRVAASEPDRIRSVRYRADGAPVAFLEEVARSFQGSDTLLQVDLKPFRPLARDRLRALARCLAPLRHQVLIGSQAHWNLRPLAESGFRVALDPTLHWRYRRSRPYPGELPLSLGRPGLWDDAPLAHEPHVALGYYVTSRVTDLRALLPAAEEWMADIGTIRFLLGRGIRLGDILRRAGVSLAAWTIARDLGAETTAVLDDLFAAGVETVISDVPSALASRYSGGGPAPRH